MCSGTRCEEPEERDRSSYEFHWSLPAPARTWSLLVTESLRDFARCAGPAIRSDGEIAAAPVSPRRGDDSDAACCNRSTSIGNIESVVSGARFRLRRLAVAA